MTHYVSLAVAKKRRVSTELWRDKIEVANSSRDNSAHSQFETKHSVSSVAYPGKIAPI